MNRIWMWTFCRDSVADQMMVLSQVRWGSNREDNNNSIKRDILRTPPHGHGHSRCMFGCFSFSFNFLFIYFFHHWERWWWFFVHSILLLMPTGRWTITQNEVYLNLYFDCQIIYSCLTFRFCTFIVDGNCFFFVQSKIPFSYFHKYK